LAGLNPSGPAVRENVRIAEPLARSTTSVGTATVTYDNIDKSAILTVKDPSTKAVFQSKRYCQYQPGKALLIKMAAILRNSATTTAVAGNTVRLGYFDDTVDKTADVGGSFPGGSGVFFQYNGGLSVGIRSYPNGTQTDTLVKQSDWNIDQLDGTGQSGKTLHPEFINVYIVELSMDAAGTCRLGVLIGGNILYCHQFCFGNTQVLPILYSQSLPVRIESVDDATAVANTSVISKLYSVSVESEGGFEPFGKPFTANSGVADNGKIIKNKSTSVPLLTIRLKASKCRGSIYPYEISLLQVSENSFFRWRLVLNGTLANSVWQSVHDYSMVEYDCNSLTTYANDGVVIMSGYCVDKHGVVNLIEVFKNYSFTSYTSQTDGMVSRSFYAQLKNDTFLEILTRPVTASNQQIFESMMDSFQVL
jgi:hypothetical protein